MSESTHGPFDELPGSARLWVFGADRPLTPAEEERILSEVDAFLDGWKAHGQPLSAARSWRYRRFLLVAADERVTPPSGCSIDALVRTLKGLEGELGVTLVDGGAVWFRDGERVRSASRADFSSLAERGEVGLETTVFDGSVTRLGELREGAWEAPAGDRWHARAFFRDAPSPSDV